MQSVTRPVTGVAALIINEGKLLLGYRTKSPGKDSWQCPGGLLETGETVFQAALREAREETGLHIIDLKPAPYTNNYFSKEDFHSVTLYVTASVSDSDLEKRELDRAINWNWFSKEQLPEPLFLPLQLLIKEHPLFWEQLF